MQMVQENFSPGRSRNYWRFQPDPIPAPDRSQAAVLLLGTIARKPGEISARYDNGIEAVRDSGGGKAERFGRASKVFDVRRAGNDAAEYRVSLGEEGMVVEAVYQFPSGTEIVFQLLVED